MGTLEAKKIAVMRIVNEMACLCRNPPKGYVCTQRSNTHDNIVDIKLRPPKGSPYEEGIFSLVAKIPRKYPEVPPKIKFCTLIYHPNVAPDGRIRLKELTTHWTPILSTYLILLQIRTTLILPQFENLESVEMGLQYLHDWPQFEEIAKEWTRKFAIIPSPTQSNGGDQSFDDSEDESEGDSGNEGELHENNVDSE